MNQLGGTTKNNHTKNVTFTWTINIYIHIRRKHLQPYEPHRLSEATVWDLSRCNVIKSYEGYALLHFCLLHFKSKTLKSLVLESHPVCVGYITVASYNLEFEPNHVVQALDSFTISIPILDSSLV